MTGSQIANIYRYVSGMRRAVAFVLLALTAAALLPTTAAARPHPYGAPNASWRTPMASASPAFRMAWRVAPRSAVRFYRAVPYRQALRTWRRPAVYAFAQRRYAAPLRVARTWRRPLYAMPALRAPASTTYAPSGVIAQAMRFVGAGNVTGMRGPWCADYASMVLRMSGHRPLASRSVSSAFAYGPRVRQPRPGDLVVVNTRYGYAQHVGFFAGYDHGQVVMVSGNWGHRVSRSPIAPGSVAAYIRI